MVERRLGTARRDGTSVVQSVEFFRDGQLIPCSTLPVGAMWFQGELLYVRLPGINDWCIDRPGTNGCRWTRTGEPPNVTVSPSINYVGSYHGWVQNGYVSDDVDGRKFNDDGKPIP
jgi:hypothetical protein